MQLSVLRVFSNLCVLVCALGLTTIVYTTYGRPVALILTMFLFGLWTGYVARTKGRNTVFWFLLGFFTGIIGLILVSVNQRSGEYDD